MERPRERPDDPAKRCKFRPEDMEDRRRLGAIEAAYEEAITETPTRWHVAPAARCATPPSSCSPVQSADCCPRRELVRDYRFSPSADGWVLYRRVWKPASMIDR